MRELNNDELSRQDFVDNMIWDCLKKLSGNPDLEYNGDYIGQLRDVFEDIIVNLIESMSEMEFYPYVIPDKTIIEIRGGCVVNIKSNVKEHSIIVIDHDEENVGDVNTGSYYDYELLEDNNE